MDLEYSETHDYDVAVVGSGTAGLVAGLRAAELGRSVAVLEKAPEERQGGHTRFSESFRVPSVGTDLEEYGYEFAVDDYTEEDFYDDIMNQTSGKANEALTTTLVENAGDTVEWLTAAGVDWQMEPLAVGYTAARTWFDGEEYVETLTAAAEDAGADFWFETEAAALHRAPTGEIDGIGARTPDGQVKFDVDAVILAAGDYGSNDEKRVRYYGPGYDEMNVRGSRYNTGEALMMAESAGANLVGQWGGAHMALIDAASPDVEGGANRVDGYQYGVILNDDGERFVDEGEDARAHTYAKFGRKIFEQPNHVGYIVLDSKAHDMVRATGPSDPVRADDFEELLTEIGCGDPAAGAETIRAFNGACNPDEFEPNVLDSNRTDGLALEKSNWAIPIDEPPYYAYAVTGGITFSFGGVKTDTDASVIDTRDTTIPGLFAAGNSTGGLFYDNYPGGTAQTNAAVYGKIAAESADGYIRS
ncbi:MULTISPECIES: FAD-dependent tricarballylate dehydrogenase TcuA [unclassified Haladaptatus]|uniref:FAD-dependent tricarballylate dehydrogenase TcuA n=1 Tax=unclassified Haladaptatus TaxID=2622732 RepID=UPI00209C355C|nr:MULTISPECIES: FAD-dependent tricarballylate dehydrogenase TcuA [unclassified Haladaptatus]MCO8246763.1 FAD-dependent tricarballylate dehydrogenase TcuA [Haladaptatus sp. AB643]MCO8256411.1 FAD-dependent tricarballylate dehydrogenase TcuA [Haladaptatus sp. AB618]